MVNSGEMAAMQMPRDIEAALPDWQPCPAPDFEFLDGRYVRIERLDAVRHGAALHRANIADDRIWRYLPYGPFASAAAYMRWLADVEASRDPMFFALVPRGEMPAGVASYLRIAPEMGTIEAGHLCFSAALQRRPAATESIYLLMRWAFEAGYRRFEWKCNAANRGSRAAAQRFGLSFEGVFRNHLVVKGHNRDSAWFAAIDAEWPALKAAFETWLSAENFGTDGQQHTALRDLTAPLLAARDPVLSDAR